MVTLMFLFVFGEAILSFVAIVGGLAVWPLALGFLILAAGNVEYNRERGKSAPLWWSIPLILLSFGCLGLYFLDVSSETLDLAAWPGLPILLYGLVSGIVFLVGNRSGKPQAEPEEDCFCENEVDAEWLAAAKAERDALVAQHAAEEAAKKRKPAFVPPLGNREENLVKIGWAHSGSKSKEYKWRSEESWENYPTPRYDAVHTYCEVVLDGGKKGYWYRTRNPELQVGDRVYVPVARNYEKKTGQIVSMENYRGVFAPFPLERTKYIAGKVK